MFRPSTGQWWVKANGAGALPVHRWGKSGDRPLSADFNDDGQTDYTVFRPTTGEWFIKLRGA